MNTLLRRAWDALDAFKQAYPENWHKEDQDVMDDLMKADLDLSGIKRKWIGLTKAERSELWWNTDMRGMPEHDYGKAIEAKLKWKNHD